MPKKDTKLNGFPCRNASILYGKFFREYDVFCANLSCVFGFHVSVKLAWFGILVANRNSLLIFPWYMAETIRLRVKCHACSNVIEGTAKYGSGHFVPEGVQFEFVAVGKVEGAQGRRVKAEVTCTCPNCGVKCKYNV